jgi:hypothetical protein
MFAMKKKGTRLEEQSIVKANFGEKPFHFPVNAVPLNQMIQHVIVKRTMSNKELDTVSILEMANASSKEKMSQEEDMKLHLVNQLTSL